MKAAGGYFEWESGEGMMHYHPEAMQLNTARNALHCILRAKQFSKIFLPEYICDVLLQPAIQLGVDVEYYSLNKMLEPDFDFEKISNRGLFLYTNYFGLKQDIVANLSLQVENLVIDNAQAFFAKPIPGVMTFYSPRKFFGVPDGAYLFAEGVDISQLPLDVSFDRCAHLLKRLDISAEAGFNNFRDNEAALSHLPPAKMSVLTQKILSRIHYNAVAEKRRFNYQYLATHLNELNNMPFVLADDAVPFCYPLIQDDPSLYARLISQSVFVPRLWPHLLDAANEDTVAFWYASKMIALPVDQRLDIEDLDRIIKLIR